MVARFKESRFYVEHLDESTEELVKA